MLNKFSLLFSFLLEGLTWPYRWGQRLSQRLLDRLGNVSGLSGPVVRGKYYDRLGMCGMCGKCCQGIFLVHGRKTIDSVPLFERLKRWNSEYRHFVVTGHTDEGLVFRCSHLTPENRCGIYENRPLFCQKYPSEQGLLMGGKLAAECGYRFEPIRKFQSFFKN